MAPWANWRRCPGRGYNGAVEEGKLVAPPLIAIVDDDGSFRRALTRLVETHGLRAATYPSAEAFLAALPRTAPSCVLLDINLPGLGGMDVLRRLAVAGEAIPSIAMTGSDRAGLRAECLKAGAAAFLSKPIGEEDLEEALAAALGPGASERR